MKTTYREIEITYQEQENNWLFELRGKERTAESLTAAKAAIDAPPPKEKDSFDKIEAWVYEGNTFKRCTVTSKAHCRYDDNRYWVSLAEGVTKRGCMKRFQANHYNIFPVSPENDKLISQWLDLDAQRLALYEQCSNRKEKLRHL